MMPESRLGNLQFRFTTPVLVVAIDSGEILVVVVGVLGCYKLVPEDPEALGSRRSRFCPASLRSW